MHIFSSSMHLFLARKFLRCIFLLLKLSCTLSIYFHFQNFNLIFYFGSAFLIATNSCFNMFFLLHFFWSYLSVFSSPLALISDYTATLILPVICYSDCKLILMVILRTFQYILECIKIIFLIHLPSCFLRVGSKLFFLSLLLLKFFFTFNSDLACSKVVEH